MRFQMLRVVTIVLSALLIAGCMFYRTDIQQTDPTKMRTDKPVVIRSPTKAHLKDGSVALFDKGFTLTNGALVGEGQQYDLTRSQRTLITSLPMESVAILEYYDKKLRPLESSLGTAGAVLASLPLLKAIFGSCPTVYTLDDGHHSLEAELFSHSIARRLEGRDLDRLEGGAPQNGEFSLRITNEALETHYINQLSLVAVDHAPGQEVFPTPDRQFAFFGTAAPLTEARSKTGRDVRLAVARRDSQWYASDPALITALAKGKIDDWIDVAVQAPPGARTMTVALRARNTLLTTVLLYDVALRSQGVRALDWMGADLGNPLAAWRLHRWFSENFSIRVERRDGDSTHDVARIDPTGPIAWHQVAQRIPVHAGENVHLRFSFLPDNWVIDWIGVSFDAAEAQRAEEIAPGALSCARIGQRANAADLGKRDKAYLITSPGDHCMVKFAVGPPPGAMQRNYFLRSRGFYIEWLREEWLAESLRNPNGEKFEPNDATIVRTAQRWLSEKPALEAQFFNTRIPLAGELR